MELTSPGPLIDKLNVNGQHSDEAKILRDDLNFEYSDTLNRDNVEQKETTNSFNRDAVPSQDDTKLVMKEADKKEKDCNEIGLKSDSNSILTNTILNENSFHTNGSFNDSGNDVVLDDDDSESILPLKHSTRPSDASNGALNGDDGCSFDVTSLKSNSNSSDAKDSTSQQKELKSTNSTEDYSGK